MASVANVNRFKECIERGIALLDKEIPGWLDKIAIDTIDLERECSCILGQSFTECVRYSGYEKGCSCLGVRAWNEPLIDDVNSSAHYGFFIPDEVNEDHGIVGGLTWQKGTSLWKSRLRQLKKERKALARSAA